MSADETYCSTTVATRRRGEESGERAEAFLSAFRDAMARFPSGVTIVTTTDVHGRPWGFTASAFCSLSASPPLVLVCIADSAECYPAFEATSRWVVNVLAHDHAELARRFATKGADKFGGDEFDRVVGDLMVLRDSAVSLVCETAERHPGGDHTILIGEVLGIQLRDRESLVHYARGFPRLSTDR